MKILLAFGLATSLLALTAPAYAKARINCTPGMLGCPVATAPVTPSASPTPATSQPPLIQGVLEALIEVQGQFVADVQAADAEATVLWPPTPAGATTPPAGQGPIDPIAHACYPTLASWAGSLALPAAPTPSANGSGPVAVFEGLRVANIVAHDLVQQIGSVGFPTSLEIACGGLVTDSVTQAGVDAGEIVSFATMLATFIPKPILLKHNVGYLTNYQKPRGK